MSAKYGTIKATIGTRTPAVIIVKIVFLNPNFSRAMTNEAIDVANKFKTVALLATITEFKKN